MALRMRLVEVEADSAEETEALGRAVERVMVAAGPDRDGEIARREMVSLGLVPAVRALPEVGGNGKVGTAAGGMPAPQPPQEGRATSTAEEAPLVGEIKPQLAPALADPKMVTATTTAPPRPARVPALPATALRRGEVVTCPVCRRQVDGAGYGTHLAAHRRRGETDLQAPKVKRRVAPADAKHVCGIEGCVERFATPQGLGRHRRETHGILGKQARAAQGRGRDARATSTAATGVGESGMRGRRSGRPSGSAPASR